MPQIKFTDTNLKTLSADSTTWFSDPTCKGLQLCVTAGGVKTWYVNKWDSTAQKTRRVKLGHQRKVAEEANPSNGLRIGHSWPGPRDDGAPGAYRITGARHF